MISPLGYIYSIFSCNSILSVIQLFVQLNQIVRMVSSRHFLKYTCQNAAAFNIFVLQSISSVFSLSVQLVLEKTKLWFTLIVVKILNL